MKKTSYRILKGIYRILSFFPKRYAVFVYAKTSVSYKNLDSVFEYLSKKMPCIKISDKISLKNVFFLSFAKIIVLDQSSKLLSEFGKNGKVCVFQIWHSSGLYKKIGFDAMRAKYDTQKEEKRIERLHKNIDFFVISDHKLISYYAKAFRIPEKKILPLGLARTDGLFHAKKYEKSKKKRLLYAPTFRTKDKKRIFVCELDIQVLQKMLGDTWTFLVRCHPSIKEHEIHNGWIDVSTGDQYDCLLQADILVTDYSSILFDYSILKRPIYLIIANQAEYEANERKLYIDPNVLCPKNVCATTKELCEKICQPYHDPMIYERFMSDCKGKSSKNISEYISHIGEQNNA